MDEDELRSTFTELRGRPAPPLGLDPDAVVDAGRRSRRRRRTGLAGGAVAAAAVVVAGVATLVLHAGAAPAPDRPVTPVHRPSPTAPAPSPSPSPRPSSSPRRSPSSSPPQSLPSTQRSPWTSPSGEPSCPGPAVTPCRRGSASG